MEKLAELYNVAEWAVYHGYREISRNTLTEIISRGGMIGRDSVLEKRLSFDGYVYSVNADDGNGRPAKLLDSLKFLEELQLKFSSQCSSEATEEYRWLRIRQLTVMQLAIFTLKETLGISIVFPQNRFSLSLPPNRPSEINFSKAITTEEVQELKAKMAKLFSQYKKYTSSTDLGRIEDQMTEAFLDALMKPFNPDSKIKPALHYLLNMFPLETFRYEATTFVKAVESEVLPSTSHVFPPIPSLTAKSEPVWDEQSREVNGPYASNSTSSAPAAVPAAVSAAPPPVFEDGSDTDAQSQELNENTPIPQSEKTVPIVNQPDNVPQKKSRKLDKTLPQPDSAAQQPERAAQDPDNAPHPDNAALQNLVARKNDFHESNTKHDPLPDAMGISNEQPVQSIAGRRKTRSMANQEKSPAKKSRLIDSRSSASEVVWTESGDEDDSTEKKSKFTIESLEKKKFVPQLSKAKAPRTPVSSPSGQSVIERDKGVRLAWSKDEEDALIAGVSIHGVGNWMQILQDPNLNFRFRGRNNVNLKDKYRNLIA